MRKQAAGLLLSGALLLGVAPLASPAPVASAAAAASGTVKIVSSVNFRTAPSVSADSLRFLRAGETVQLLDQPNRSWLHVKDSAGKTGYVSSSAAYVQITAPSAGQAPGDKTAAPSVPAVPSVPAATSDASSAIEKAIAAGMKYWGTPYEFASSRSNTKTFDCSDFVRQAFLDGIGLRLPSDSRGQAAFVKSVGKKSTDWRSLKRGDLVFFMSYKGSKPSDYPASAKAKATVTHVGIYLGDGKVLHTYSTASGGVKETSIAGNAWEYRILFGGSAL